jgi:hypothetical protein
MLRAPRPDESSDYHRGHKMKLLDGVWLYCDTGQPVSDDPDRPCGYCGLANTPEGHDGCLGEIPGVRNACCGHGEAGSAYVQFNDGTRRGKT